MRIEINDNLFVLLMTVIFISSIILTYYFTWELSHSVANILTIFYCGFFWTACFKEPIISIKFK